MSAILDTALHYLESGISVIPVLTNGSKAAAFKNWDIYYRDRRATLTELDGWFERGDRGIGIIAGAQSGGLEIMDFEELEAFETWYGILKSWDADDILNTLIYVETPSGGRHAYYRCPEAIEGGRHLARRPAENKQGYEVLIETRAHGQYVVAPGSPPECHPAMLPYIWINGEVEDIPTITPDQRIMLHEAAASLNECIEEKRPIQPLEQREGLPGDDFNNRALWEDILLPHGWRVLYERNGMVEWQRPGATGKNGSARQNWKGRDHLTVFTESDEKLKRGFYSKFAAYTFLNFNGNFRMAAFQLARDGYGYSQEQRQQQTLRITSVLDNTDLSNADAFIQLNGSIIRSGPGKGNFFYYNGRHWEKSEEKVGQLAQDFIRKMELDLDDVPAELRPDRAKWVKQSGNASRIEAILKLARANKKILINGTEFDKNPQLICVANGVLHLGAGELYPHDPEYYCSTITDIMWDPTARAPHFEKYLNYISGDNPQMRQFLLSVGGLCLSGMLIDKLFFFNGKPRTGKTSLAEFILSCSGGYGCATDKKLLLVRRNGSTCSPEERMVLFGKHCVLLDREVDEDDRFDESTVKSLSGGNSLQGRDLYSKPITFQPRCKFIAQGNSRPRAGFDEAFHDRMVPVPFDFVIPEGERDPDFVPRLMATEAPGILRLFQSGFVHQFNHGLLLPDPVQVQRKEYKQESDFVGQVLDEAVIEDSSNYETFSDLFQMFIRYCKAYNQPVLSMQKFGRRLADRYGNRKKRKNTGFIVEGIRITKRYCYAQESFDSNSAGYAGTN